MQDFLTFLVEALLIVSFCFILLDIVNQARYFGGYQIPKNWQPPTIAQIVKLVEATQILELKPQITISPLVETAPTIRVESQVEPVQIVASLINFPDPWTMPMQDTKRLPHSQQQLITFEPKPLLLLPPARVVPSFPVLGNARSELDELLVNVNLNKLPLRTARKVAKVLGIAQKVNKKDVPLNFLRSQIKSKLQHSQELPEIFATVRELLAS